MPTALARSINAAKWRTKTNLSHDEVPADAVFADLRTNDNVLSFWSCRSEDPASLDDVVLAVAANRDHLEKVDLVWFPEGDVKSIKLNVRATPGETPASSLVDTHRDVVGIDVVRLAKLAGLVDAAVCGDSGSSKRYTARDVRRILEAALERDVLEVAHLKPDVAKKLSA